MKLVCGCGGQIVVDLAHTGVGVEVQNAYTGEKSIYSADKYVCLNCNHVVYADFARMPMAVDTDTDYAVVVKKLKEHEMFVACKEKL